MASRKTQYLVPFQSDVQTVNGVVASWLQANGFVQRTMDGYQYYLSENMMTGNRCFEYYFQGSQLIILGYLKTPKKPFALDQGLFGAASTVPYVNLIQELIRKVNSLPPTSQNPAQPAGSMPGQFQPQSPVNPAQGSVVVEAAADFEEKAEKKNGNCAIGAFVASILSLLIAFSGIIYVGGLGYILLYAFAITGLKSKKKKGLAIAAIVITSFSLILFILLFILAIIAKSR